MGREISFDLGTRYLYQNGRSGSVIAPLVNEHDENHDETSANIISLVNIPLITILHTWLAVRGHLLKYLS
jgi:hypothetical protein